MPNLKTANFSHNWIESINEISDLPSLLNFDLSSNSIETLPENIGELKTVKKFKVSDNDLKILPKSIGNMKWVFNVVLM